MSTAKTPPGEVPPLQQHIWYIYIGPSPPDETLAAKGYARVPEAAWKRSGVGPQVTDSARFAFPLWESHAAIYRAVGTAAGRSP